MPFYEVALDWKHRNVRWPGPVEDRFTLGVGHLRIGSHDSNIPV
jgi:hypothetical protein